jgi:formylglycine-generating enzyme required for sulfatase activity
MGSPATEAGREGGPKGPQETQHRRRIRQSIAIAAKEVTVAQFRRFRPNHIYSAQFAPTTDHPVTAVRWYEAAAYCNWLSKQEGIPEDQWCYQPNSKGEYAKGMKRKGNYLELAGYRLPSEAEWEYACRAGAKTSRCYGETAELLGKYAWYQRNSESRELSPVGSLKPNDFGLFDLHGNALEWCQDRIALYSPGEPEREDTETLQDTMPRVLRGGSFFYQAMVVRSAYRDRNLPGTHLNDAGFRPVRTFR